VTKAQAAYQGCGTTRGLKKKQEVKKSCCRRDEKDQKHDWRRPPKSQKAMKCNRRLTMEKGSPTQSSRTRSLQLEKGSKRLVIKYLEDQDGWNRKFKKTIETTDTR